MAISTVDGWFAGARQRIRAFKRAVKPTAGGQMTDTTDMIGYPYGTTTLVVNSPSDASAYCAPIANYAGGATGYLSSLRFRNTVASSGYVLDRLAQSNSQSVVTSAAGTVNYPVTTCSAVPNVARLVNGYPNEAMVYIRTVAAVVGGTITVNCTYTNQAGVTGRVSPTFSVDATANVVTQMPLAQGDTGVQSVQTITVIASAALTAGSLELNIARLLATADVRAVQSTDFQAWDATGGIVIPDTAALWFVVQPDSTSPGSPSWELTIVSG